MILIAGWLSLASGGASAEPLLYVGNYAGEVHVVDSATNAVVDTIPTANGSGLVVHPDGSRVYVVVGSAINVYDTSNYAPLGTIQGPVGGIAINSTGTRLYISSYFDSFVRVVDTSTLADVATPIPSPQATTVAVSPDGTRVYVTDQNTRVYVLDATTNTPLTYVTVGNFVTGLAVHPSGAFLYAANTNDNTLSVVDTQTNSVVATVPFSPPGCCYQGPTGIAVHPAGTFVYTMTADMTLQVIRTSDNTLVASIPTTPNSPGADGTTFLTVHPDGSTLYISKYSGGTVTAVATLTNAVTATIAIPGAPGMLAFVPQSTITTLGVSPNPSVWGQTVTMTATVTAATGTPNGTVTFYDAATAIGTGTLNASGVATFSTGTLAAGPHSLTARYGGATGYRVSTSGAIAQSVSKAASTTTVASSPNPSVFGQLVNFSATVTCSGGATPVGLVTFKEGNTAIGTASLDASGAATFGTSSLLIGSHNIKAAYGGNANCAGGSSSAVAQVVNGQPTTTTVASSANPAATGATVTFTATVTQTGAGTPTGSVTFKDGNKSIGTGTLSVTGQATLTTTSLKKGSHSITAIYAGDTTFATSTSAALTQVITN